MSDLRFQGSRRLPLFFMLSCMWLIEISRSALNLAKMHPSTIQQDSTEVELDNQINESVSVSLYVCLSIYLSIYLSVCLYVYPSMNLFISVCLCIHPSLRPSVRASVCLSVCLICLCACSMCVYRCPSIRACIVYMCMYVCMYQLAFLSVCLMSLFLCRYTPVRPTAPPPLSFGVSETSSSYLCYDTLDEISSQSIYSYKIHMDLKGMVQAV
jgi:hypothetical protein